MKATFRSVLLIALACLLFGTAIMPVQAEGATTRKRKRIAVVNFEVPKTVYGAWGNEGAQAANRLSNVLADMMITSLVKSGSFDVIERTELEKILKEHELDAQGLLDPTTAPKAGKILGVDLIFGGKITEFGVKEKKTGGFGALAGGFLGIDYRKSTARVAIDARVVNTTTAKILLAEKGEGENSEQGISFAGSDFSSFLAGVRIDSEEWTESRIGRATRTAIDQVIGKVVGFFPVEASILAALPDGAVILDLGRFSGIKEGDQFELMSITLIKDEETGEVVFEDQKCIGLLKVDVLQDERCKCVPVGELADGARPKRGDVAVLKRTPPDDDKKGKKK